MTIPRRRRQHRDLARVRHQPRRLHRHRVPAAFRFAEKSFGADRGLPFDRLRFESSVERDRCVDLVRRSLRSSSSAARGSGRAHSNRSRSAPRSSRIVPSRAVCASAAASEAGPSAKNAIAIDARRLHRQIRAAIAARPRAVATPPPVRRPVTNAISGSAAGTSSRTLEGSESLHVMRVREEVDEVERGEAPAGRGQPARVA